MKTEAIQEHKSKDITGHHGSWTVATNISLAVWFEGQLDSKAQLGGRHLEPTDAGTLTPRSRPPASLVTEVLSSKELGGGPCDKDRTGKVKGMETEVQPGLRVIRMQRCQRLKLLSLLQRTNQCLISLFLVAMISLLCYSDLLSLHQHLLFARGAAYQGWCSPPKDSAYRFCFPTLGEQSDG